MKRRYFLAGSIAGLSNLASIRWTRAASKPLFRLGIASGDATSNAVVLWTRIAPEPMLADGGLGNTAVPVTWEVAVDPAMDTVIRRGEQLASPALGHSVHIDVQGLDPGRNYWYRFAVDNQYSATGRTQTLAQNPTNCRFVSTSCQNYTHGYFVAYDHIVADQPEFVLHLGDYIYDTSFGETFRDHDSEKAPTTLAEFRRRHALYKTDEHLQHAHSQLPFFTVLDNHDALEDNNPAQYPQRAAAYQAWYEHMPVRGFHPARPNQFDMQRHILVGDLMQIALLDTRQFRDKKDLCANLEPSLGFGNYRPRCEELFAPDRSMLGTRQESWLYDVLRDNQANWNVVASSGPVTPIRIQHEGKELGYIGSWGAYPANRQRLNDAIRSAKKGHPIILSGDLHSFWALDGNRISDPIDQVPAVEFVSSSISANWPEPLARPIRENLDNNPQIEFYEGAERGYLLHDVSRTQWQTRYRAVGDASNKGAGVRDIKSYSVEKGQPGLQEIKL